MGDFHYHLSYGQRFFLASMPVMAVVLVSLGMYLLVGVDARSKAKWQADMSTLYYLQSAQKYDPASVWSSLSQSRIYALQALAYQPFDRGLWQHVVRLDQALQTPRMADISQSTTFSTPYKSASIAQRLAIISDLPLSAQYVQKFDNRSLWSSKDMRIGALESDRR